MESPESPASSLAKQPLPVLKWSTPPLPSSAAGGRSTASRTPPVHLQPPSSAQPMPPPASRQQNPPPANHATPPPQSRSQSMATPAATRPHIPPPTMPPTQINSASPHTKATPSSSSKPSRPPAANDLLLPTSLLEPMPGAEDLHLVSPSAAALRAISLQSPAHARPRNSPTPGPRSAQSHRPDFDPAVAVGTHGSMFPSLTLQPIVQGGGLMTSYGALRQEIRGSGGGATTGGSFTTYGAGKEGYAARAAARAVSEGRLPPGAMILPGSSFEDSGGDLPEGWDLKERPQGLMNLIQEGSSKSFTGVWTHHPFILPAEEPHPQQVRQKAQAGKEGSYAASLSRASERASHREGPPAAKSSGSSGTLNSVSVKEVGSSNASSSDQPPPLSANNRTSPSLRTSTSYAAPPASASRPKPVSGAVPLSQVKRTLVGAPSASQASSPALVARQAPVAKPQVPRPPAPTGP